MAVINGSGWTGIIEGVDTGDTVEEKHTSAYGNIDDDVAAVNTELGNKENTGAKDKIAFTPQVTPPTHVEGQVYYNADKEEFRLQGPFTGVEVPVGHGEHIHVINNSGATIEKGMACRHNGVALGEVQIEKAIATSFVNARVFGAVAEDILNGERGALVTSGEIDDMDTSTLTVGVPQYLSDTIAGTYTEVPPDIITQVGGAITQDALAGRFYVDRINNTNLPTVLSGLKDLTTPTVPVTIAAQDVVNYVAKEEIVMLADLTTGVLTVSNDGYYRINVAADISFPSSTSTRTIYIEVYDIANTNILYTYTKNIPRDATEDGFGFSYPFSSITDNQYKLRVRASTAFTVTVNDVTFDIQSISIT